MCGVKSIQWQQQCKQVSMIGKQNSWHVWIDGARCCINQFLSSSLWHSYHITTVHGDIVTVKTLAKLVHLTQRRCCGWCAALPRPLTVADKHTLLSQVCNKDNSASSVYDSISLGDCCLVNNSLTINKLLWHVSLTAYACIACVW